MHPRSTWPIRTSTFCAVTTEPPSGSQRSLSLAIPLPALTAQEPAKANTEKAAKGASKTSRKPGADCILFILLDAQKEPKGGSKRAAIIDMLRKPAGTTVEEIAAATGWSRAVASSALWVDVKGGGFGVERREGRLHLVPEGAKC